MEILSLQETTQTPKMFFDTTAGIIKIEGKSYSDDINETYEELFEYIDKYLRAPLANTTLEFKWLYYNTATAKVIAKIILKLKVVPDFKVIWYYKSDFIMMKEKGDEFKSVFGINLDVVAY